MGKRDNVANRRDGFIQMRLTGQQRRRSLQDHEIIAAENIQQIHPLRVDIFPMGTSSCALPLLPTDWPYA